MSDTTMIRVAVVSLFLILVVSALIVAFVKMARKPPQRPVELWLTNFQIAILSDWAMYGMRDYLADGDVAMRIATVLSDGMGDKPQLMEALLAGMAGLRSQLMGIEVEV